REGPSVNEIPVGGGTYLVPTPFAHPPAASGNVSPPLELRQKPPVRQNGAFDTTPNCAPPPPEFSHPPAPTLAMWYCRPSSPIPSPPTDRPRAEYSQSIRWRVDSPGVGTAAPLTQASSAG